MSVLRKSVIAVADNPAVSRAFHTEAVRRRLVERFVAGESLDSALTAAQGFKGEGITTTLDLLGENVTSVEQAESAVSTYQAILLAMQAQGLDPNISVKLTMLGLDFGEDVALSNMKSILASAQEANGFVRIDMEGSAYTDVTMRVFEHLYARYPKQVGIVIQAYLHRAEADIERTIELGARVRLVKGAYAEPPEVAIQDKSQIDANFGRLAQRLLSDGNYPAIATHDLDLVRSAIEYARVRQVSPERYEFQMLYGVRRDQQSALVDDGYRMRVYVPYGTEWYPYFTRRIAERPANALFVLRQLRG